MMSLSALLTSTAVPTGAGARAAAGDAVAFPDLTMLFSPARQFVAAAGTALPFAGAAPGSSGTVTGSPAPSPIHATVDPAALTPDDAIALMNEGLTVGTAAITPSEETSALLNSEPVPVIGPVLATRSATKPSMGERAADPMIFVDPLARETARESGDAVKLEAPPALSAATPIIDALAAGPQPLVEAGTNSAKAESPRASSGGVSALVPQWSKIDSPPSHVPFARTSVGSDWEADAARGTKALTSTGLAMSMLAPLIPSTSLAPSTSTATTTPSAETVPMSGTAEPPEAREARPSAPKADVSVPSNIDAAPSRWTTPTLAVPTGNSWVATADATRPAAIGPAPSAQGLQPVAPDLLIKAEPVEAVARDAPSGHVTALGGPVRNRHHLTVASPPAHRSNASMPAAISAPEKPDDMPSPPEKSPAPTAAVPVTTPLALALKVMPVPLSGGATAPLEHRDPLPDPELRQLHQPAPATAAAIAGTSTARERGDAALAGWASDPAAAYSSTPTGGSAPVQSALAGVAQGAASFGQVLLVGTPSKDVVPAAMPMSVAADLTVAPAIAASDRGRFGAAMSRPALPESRPMTLAALVSPPDLLAALVMAPAAAAAPAPIIVPALSPREVLPPAVPAAEPRPAAAPDPAIDVGGSTPLVGAPPRPDALVPSPAAPRLAGQVFAVALHAAALAGRRRGIPDGATATTAPFGVVASAATLSVPAAPLDLRRADWPARMVDHIELLRDAADAVSTRIRISPDALGPVDVQVRRDGDELHVHLIAQHAETRALLSEAQPQLSSLAAERGVRLGQTSVGAGTGGESSRQQPASGQRTTPPRPASAPTHADHPDIDDTRIA